MGNKGDGQAKKSARAARREKARNQGINSGDSQNLIVLNVVLALWTHNAWVRPVMNNSRVITRFQSHYLSYKGLENFWFRSLDL